MNERIDKINYYLDIAEAVSKRSTCLRKQTGCVIVNHDEIISTGYSGAPRGRKNCIDLGYCCKKKFFPDIRHAGYDACRSVHAEQNALISARRQDMIGGTLYLVMYNSNTGNYEIGANCCQLCRMLIINAVIKNVIIRKESRNEYEIIDVDNWVEHDDLLDGKITF